MPCSACSRSARYSREQTSAQRRTSSRLAQGRRSVRAAVEHVELVSELVVDHVVAALGVAPRALHRVPDQDHGTPELGLADDGKRHSDGLEWDLEGSRTSLRNDHRGWVDEDRLYVAVELMGDPQDQQTGLGRDRDSHFVGQRESATALPAFLGYEHPDELAQMLLLPGVEPAIVSDVAENVGFPARGKGSCQQLPATAVSKPVQHAGAENSRLSVLRTRRGPPLGRAPRNQAAWRQAYRW